MSHPPEPRENVGATITFIAQVAQVAQARPAQVAPIGRSPSRARSGRSGTDERPGLFQLVLGPRLLDQIEAAVIEGLAGCGLHADEALAAADLEQLQGAVVAKGVVAAAAEQDVCRPGA